MIGLRDINICVGNFAILKSNVLCKQSVSGTQNNIECTPASSQIITRAFDVVIFHFFLSFEIGDTSPANH